MQERRTSSSTTDHLGSTLEQLAAFVPMHHHRSRSKGFSERGHRIFNIGSSVFMTLVAIGWIWSIDNSRDELVQGTPSTAGIISRALTDSRSPSVAYLTDAALDFVSPLRGESGKLHATLQQPGAAIPVDTLPHGASVTIGTGVPADPASVVTAPHRTGI